MPGQALQPLKTGVILPVPTARHIRPHGFPRSNAFMISAGTEIGMRTHYFLFYQEGAGAEAVFESLRIFCAASGSVFGPSWPACMQGVSTKPCSCRSSRHAEQGIVLLIFPPSHQHQSLHGLEIHLK